MYTEKQLRDELYEKVCKRYYIKMNSLMSLAKEEISIEEFEKQIRENSKARSQEELEKQVSGAINEVISILEAVKTSGGIGKSPVEIAKELRKQSKGDPSKNALDTILPYLQEHPNDSEAVETFGWVMYDFIKSYENDPARYKKALAYLNANAHFCNEKMMTQPDGAHVLIPISYFSSFMRVIKINRGCADNLFPIIMDFVESKDDFLRSDDPELHKSSRYLYMSLISNLSIENQLHLFNNIGTDWLSSKDYIALPSSSAPQNRENKSCFAELILYKFSKALVSRTPSQENLEMAKSLITAIEFHNRRSGFKFTFADYYLAKLFLFINNKPEALIKAMRFIPGQKKSGYAWQLLANCSEGENKLAFLCAALLCGSEDDVKVGIQKEAIPILAENKLYRSACFEVDSFENTYNNNHDWRTPEALIASWKETDWYQSNKSAGNRDPLKSFADKANSILISNLPMIHIFTDYVNSEKGTVSFIFKEERYKQGFFYIDTCDASDIKPQKVYTARIEPNRKKANLYNVYNLQEVSSSSKPFVQEDHGTIHLPDYGDFAFVSSSSMIEGDTYIPAKLVERYDLEEDMEINYEKAMSWDKKKNTMSWTMTRLIRKGNKQ